MCEWVHMLCVCVCNTARRQQAHLCYKTLNVERNEYVRGRQAMCAFERNE